MNREQSKQEKDVLILQQWQNAPELAFQLMFTTYYEEMCRHIYRYVPRPQATEDIAQEIFTELWVKREQIEIKSSIGAYLHRMAVTRALNYIRDNKKHIHVSEEPLAKEKSGLARQDDLLTAGELEIVISDTIHQLPERCKQVFLLSRFENLSYKEIADQMDISVKTVENQMIKALKNLREAVHQYKQDHIGD